MDDQKPIENNELELSPENARKLKKARIIAEWVWASNKQYPITKLLDAETTVSSVIDGGISNVNLKCPNWNEVDADWIARQSMIDLPIEELTQAILRGLNFAQTEPEPDRTNFKFCPGCKRWLRYKPDNLSKFPTSRYSTQCKVCLRIDRKLRYKTTGR
jgi:hypothetical protein